MKTILTHFFYVRANGAQLRTAWLVQPARAPQLEEEAEEIRKT